jgi:hypothetical protein
MAKLKSQRHHWWPRCVSARWAAEDGTVGWLKPDGTSIRVPAKELGAIGNAHHIKPGRFPDGSTPLDTSFENAFDMADTNFPLVISWLESLHHEFVPGPELRDRFLAEFAPADKLRLLTECVVSLAVRSPMNREASVSLAQLTKGVGATEAYARLMGLVQNAMSGLNSTAGAISIGAAGHQFGAITNALAGWTPTRNPNAKAYAEAKWGGENAPNHSETRAQIRSHPGFSNNAGAYTVPNFDFTVGSANSKPLFSVAVTATRHMANDVSADTYKKLWSIEDRSVRIIERSVGNLGVRLNDRAARGFPDVPSGFNEIRRLTPEYMGQEMRREQILADGMGGNQY